MKQFSISINDYVADAIRNSAKSHDITISRWIETASTMMLALDIYADKSVHAFAEQIHSGQISLEQVMGMLELNHGKK
jgi:hypothetical protein